ncbi:unnamed protein product, partial [Lampetra planeri]
PSAAVAHVAFSPGSRCSSTAGFPLSLSAHSAVSRLLSLQPHRCSPSPPCPDTAGQRCRVPSCGDHATFHPLPCVASSHLYSYTLLPSDNSLLPVLKTLLFFTILMITMPIGLYFATKVYVFEGSLGMSNRDSYFYAAIVAVVAVHVVLAMFVYVAWNEGSRQWRDGKQD